MRSIDNVLGTFMKGLESTIMELNLEIFFRQHLNHHTRCCLIGSWRKSKLLTQMLSNTLLIRNPKKGFFELDRGYEVVENGFNESFNSVIVTIRNKPIILLLCWKLLGLL